MVQASEYEDRRQKVMVDNAEIIELKTSTHSESPLFDCCTVLWHASLLCLALEESAAEMHNTF
jgi:hypothetical protein